MKTTKRLAEFVATIPSDQVPPAARDQARRAILDTLGVMLAGSRESASAITAQMVREQSGPKNAAVFGHSFHAPAAEAALVNGTSAHALDFDDVNMSMRGHPSVPLLPAVLALGEELGSSGREVLDAFVLGFEVECKLGRVIGGPHYALGWHATSTLGTLGATAACARLLRLDEKGTQTALGLAASLSSGVRQNFGTMTKPLHAGWAARNGVIAATLAQRGFTADEAALEGESGLLRAASGGISFDASQLDCLGQPWDIVSPGIAVKLYPCCYATHRAIDAALEIRADLGARHPRAAFGPASLFDICVWVSPGTMMPLITKNPSSSLEAKFSLEYCVATALIDGRVTLASFADDATARPEVLELMSRIDIAEEGAEAEFPIGGRAHIQLAFRPTRGKAEITDSTIIEMPKGDPQNPLSWDELGGKFRDCASAVLPENAVEETIETVGALDELENIGRLASVLSPESIHA